LDGGGTHDVKELGGVRLTGQSVLHETPNHPLSKSRARAAARLGRAALPYRGEFGAPRPAELGALALPPAPMPARRRWRPLKAWRYVGVFGPELMICVAAARIGPARQSFWAVWDRTDRTLYERTSFGRGGVTLPPGRVQVSAGGLRLSLALQENAGVETVCHSGAQYAWTRKQGGIRASGTLVMPDGRGRVIDGRAIVDDTAAYYQRHTCWRWSAGVGTAVDGRPLAWNLVDGVNDPVVSSERTVWVDGRPAEAGPVRFATDLSAVGDLRFDAEATRQHRQNLGIVRSRYRQPFGTFSGRLPTGPQLACGYGVMEEHDVWW
jgi:Protein of unknown function (DUF2804)